jgi:hypothetical protein
MVPSIVISPLFVRVYPDNNNVSPVLIIRFVPELTIELSLSVQSPGGGTAFSNWYRKMVSSVDTGVGVGVGVV